ncbi:heat shock factor protein 5 [Limosa lapponica baueri]|uniref:Heat shock factor protein 5 n=1 Tax=Limosa lapponica baueri TaxID=1758121 RepID=A0A2I0TEB4_LIMLA|nr:heat shock factor protein 5 [Limosa lapponica baueri]
MEEPRLPAAINPSNFPAKLWQLVNSPRFRSIRWDARGEGLLIDQPLFEHELLGARPGHAAGLASNGANLFKTKNFTSFIRQLNLYGFRKVVAGPAGSVAGPRPELGPGSGDGDSSTGPLHHFHSPHFRRDRPELLVNLKRLTSANKAKLAAGLDVTSRPPNRFQRLFGPSLHGNLLLPPSTLGEANRPGETGRAMWGHGLLTVGQFHQPYRRDSFFPYSYMSTSSQNHSTLPTKSFDRTPVPSRTWQGSLGLLPGHEASPAFPDRGAAFPALQRFPTEVTYTLQPVASLLPLQQGSQTIATSLPKYSSYTSSVQYSQAYYPTEKATENYGVGRRGGMDGSTQTQWLVRSPPMHSPYAAEFLPSNWPCDTFEENKKAEENLEALFRAADEMCSSPKTDMVKVEPVESLCSTPQSNRGQLVNIENIDTPSSTEESQLESLSPVASDTSFVVGADQAVTCSPSQPSEFLRAACATASAERAAAGVMQEFVSTREAHDNLREEPAHGPAPSSAVFAQEAPFSPEQVG